MYELSIIANNTIYQNIIKASALFCEPLAYQWLSLTNIYILASQRFSFHLHLSTVNGSSKEKYTENAFKCNYNSPTLILLKLLFVF